VICDWNLTAEELAKYKVLVLPNAACLGDAQCKAVREFVEQGGGLVASLDTSLCNEFGDPREDFSLADVFGVHHRGVVTTGDGGKDVDANFAKGLDDAYWEKRKNVFDLRVTLRGAGVSSANESALRNLSAPFTHDAKLQELLGREPFTFKGPAVKLKLAEDKVDTLVTCFPKGSDEAKNSSPAIVTHSFGKGRVAYFAAGIDAGYYGYAYPYQRRLLSQAIRWAASEKPPVEVQAPMCVHATTFRQQKEGQQRLLVHLYNDVNTTAFHGLPNDDVPLREETLPIHDIRIALRGYNVKKIVQQPEEKELTIGGDGLIVVPRLDVHSIVVVDLKEDTSR